MCLCGSREHMTADHVIPRCAGGTDETHNLNWMHVLTVIKANHMKTGVREHSRQSFYDPYKESQILEWQKQNINTEERAGQGLDPQ